MERIEVVYANGVFRPIGPLPPAVKENERYLVAFEHSPPVSSPPGAGQSDDQAIPDPLLGTMRDAADELDAVVAEAMGNRAHQPWRLSPRE
jgi:hypothetical protein